jgi:hypothetical protein
MAVFSLEQLEAAWYPSIIFGNLGNTMVFDEDEIEKSHGEESSKSAPARRAAAEKRRRTKIYADMALKAKKAKDARAYAEVLRLGNVRENSEEWKIAWKYFYS